VFQKKGKGKDVGEKNITTARYLTHTTLVDVPPHALSGEIGDACFLQSRGTTSAIQRE